MSVLYWLESIRTPFTDTLMSWVTHLGSEAVFIVVALWMFWCVDKYRGYYLLSIGFFGAVLNQFLKLFFRIPRPWVRDPSFTIVESARAEATGYSFPSGHTQNVVGTLGGVARSTQRRWLRLVCVLLAALTAFSRMYLGVHTPLDVGVSAVIALLLVFVLYPVMRRAAEKPGAMALVFALMLASSLAYLLFAECYGFPADVDAENLQEGLKNAYSLLGALLGIVLVYAVDEKWLRFSTRAGGWGQLLKLVLGLGVVLLVKSVLKAPLLALFGGHNMAHLLRYFLMVLTAGVLWPLTFPFFAGLGGKKHASGAA